MLDVIENTDVKRQITGCSVQHQDDGLGRDRIKGFVLINFVCIRRSLA